MIEMIIEQRRRNLGGGMEVGRVLPFAKRRMVGPFIFFDHIGPLNLGASVDHSVDVRPHPHIGLYEPGLVVAEGDFVAIHGRIRGWAEAPQGVVDLFRIEDGN